MIEGEAYRRRRAPLPPCAVEVSVPPRWATSDACCGAMVRVVGTVVDAEVEGVDVERGTARSVDDPLQLVRTAAARMAIPIHP